MTALTLGFVLLAQAAPVVAPGTEVRALTATILDETGAAVEGLGADDVALLENGVARDITSFKADRRPLTVAVILDTSQVIRDAYRLNIVEGVVAFIARLPLGTRYAIWTTGDRPTKIVDYTEDRAEASKALPRVFPQGGNYMLDGLSEASRDLRKLSREGDRAAVVVLTATGPEFSYRDRYRAAEEAVANADLILAMQIDSGGADFETRVNLGYVLDRITRTSGGELEVVLSSLGVDGALRKLSPWFEGGYRIAYATVPDLKKRKLELTVARPGSRVVLPEDTDTGP